MVEFDNMLSNELHKSLYKESFKDMCELFLKAQELRKKKIAENKAKKAKKLKAKELNFFCIGKYAFVYNDNMLHFWINKP